MKKIIYLLLFIFMLSLASCVVSTPSINPGKDDPGTNQPSDPNQPGESTLLEFEGIVFDDKAVIYDGNEHTIEVTNLPSFASVTYTNAGPHINVGTYEITAEVKAEGYKTLTLKATLVIDPSEEGLSFEEYNRYIVNKPYSDLPHTVEMDIKLDENVSGDAGSLFGNFDWGVYGGAGTGHGRLFHTDISNGILRLEYTNEYYNRETITFDGVDLRTGDWVNVALTIDADNKIVNLYVDGEFKLSKSITADLTNLITKTFYHIGGDNRTLNPFWFKGEIREVAVFSDVRSESEIANDYLEGIDLNDEDLIAQYYLASVDRHQNIVDNSGNDYWLRYEDTWYDEQEIEMDYAYSFAVVGDTQMLNYWAPGANGEQHDATKIANNMNGLYKWILDNQESQKIQHVFGLGDITETWAKNDAQAAVEWGRAKDAIYQMNGKISYSLIRGNHDESTYMNQYFNEEVYTSQFDEFYNDTINTFYKTLKAGSVDYLFLGLDYGASDAELEWAGSIVEAHPNHKVIVTTHGYLEQEGHRSGSDDPDHPCDASDVDSDANYNNGEGIWEKFISKYENIFLVMSGHKFDEDVVCKQSYGIHGNVVTQMLIDFQDVDKQLVGSKGEDPAGIVTMLYFNEDGTIMEVSAYSTVRNKFYKKYNHFTVDLEGVCKDNHKLTYHEGEKATCTTNGTLEYYSCSICGTNFDKDGNVLLSLVAEATGHSYDDGVKNGQEMIYTCTNCGDSYVETLGCTIEVNHLYLDGSVASPKEVLEKSENKMYTINAKTIPGYIASHDYVKVYTSSVTNVINIYYSEVDVWDGTSISESLSGTGTATDPYIIDSAADMVYLQKLITDSAAGTDNLTNTYYKMTKSIDMNGHSLQIGVYPGWGSRKAFNGVFDGNNCSIRGLVINNTTQSTALFGAVGSNGVIKNLNVYGTVTGTNYVGGIVAYNQGTIEDCTNYTTVSANSYFVGGVLGYNEKDSGKIFDSVNYGTVNGNSDGTGGIVGCNKFNLSGCVNYGTVTGSTKTGGIVGADQETTGYIKNSINYGDVIATSSNAGGIVGHTVSPVSDSTNFGLVEASNELGGIAGTSTSSITNCVNNGVIKGTATHTAGIVGNVTGNVISCTNNGDIISGGWGIGGIAGYSVGSKFENCTNNGNISNVAGQVGGIIGKADNNTILNCTNNGYITTNNGIVGGIIGTQFNSNSVYTAITIKSCVNNGVIKGTAIIGGVVGEFQEGTITDSHNYGEVNGAANTGGFIGKIYNYGTTTIISNCSNEGNVNASGWGSGGFAGFAHKVSFTDCANKGNVNGTSTQVGGFAGALYSLATATNCHNYGVVTGLEQVGGIAGNLQGKLVNCDNYGKYVATKSGATTCGPIYGALEGNNHSYTDCEDYYQAN